jgi:hypothetical protein
MNNPHMLETRALIERLNASWSKDGVCIQPGASIEQIEAFETQYQVHLPSDFREYFITINGMERWETDENMFSFLPIDAIKSIPEELADFGGIPDYRPIMRTLTDPHHWFVIVDYLITSAVFAIRLSEDVESTPVISISDGNRHRVVAQSFSAFLERYLATPYELL